MMPCLQVYKKINLSHSVWSSERKESLSSETTERHLLESHKNATNNSFFLVTSNIHVYKSSFSFALKISLNVLLDNLEFLSQIIILMENPFTQFELKVCENMERWRYTWFQT